MTLGEKIAKSRKDMHMSQVELAARLGTTKQTIGKYEAGIVTEIPLSKIQKIADILNVSPEYLCGWEIEKAPETVEISETKKKLYALIDSMSDEKAERLLAFLKE